MAESHRSLRVMGLEVSARTAAIPGFVGLWAMLAVAARFGLGFGWGQAVGGGALGTLAHFLGEFLHQVGHATAARRTGYPMRGMRFGMLGVLALSQYPEDEPNDLPARVHIQRALGGPLFSLGLGVIVGLVTGFAFGPPLGLPEAVLFFFAAENLLVYCIGALLPLGFTDGSTILRYRRERRSAESETA